MAKSKYNPEYHKNWAWSLAIRGATDDEIADAFGVSVRTINRWKKQFPEFLEILTNSKSRADANVERSLYERAIGYKWEEEEQLVEVDTNGVPKPLKIRKLKKHAPPDVMAQMYWLNNRKPDVYRRNPQFAVDSTVKEISKEAMQQVEDFLKYGDSEEEPTTEPAEKVSS